MIKSVVETLLIDGIPLILAITLHEAAHAYAAKRLGDFTAFYLGRVSLNPIKHIDPIGTLLIPIVLKLIGSPILFGYAKPVPVNFLALNHPKRDMIWVALAGPASNWIQAVLWTLLLSILLATANAQDLAESSLDSYLWSKHALYQRLNPLVFLFCWDLRFLAYSVISGWNH